MFPEYLQRAVLTFLFMMTALALLPRALTAAEINAVQSGTATIASGSSTVTVNITAVDPTRSFLVFNMRFSDENPGNGQVSGQITNSTTLTFRRQATGPEVNIAWYVAEFSSGVTVQRGAVASDFTTSVSLNAVDLTRSFPIISYRTPGSLFNQDDYVQAKITSSTNLDLTINTYGANNATIEWQVVEFDEASVQTGDLSFNPGTSSLTASPTAVDPAKSWLLYSYRSNGGTISNIGQKLIRGLITDPSTLTFERENTGQQLNLTWYLVEFTDATTVQHGSAHFPTSNTVQQIPLSTVNVSKTLATSGHYQRGGKSPYSGGDNPGVAWVTTELTSNTLTMTRDFAGSTADVGYFVVTFEQANTGPPVVVSAIPDTTVDEDSPLDNYRDLKTVFNDPDEGGNLTFTVESNSNPGLVSATVDVGDALDLSLVLDQTGSSTIVVRATDAGALFAEDTFVLTVTPVNDAPRVAVQIPDTTVSKGSPSIVSYRDLNEVFDDPEEGAQLGFLEWDNSNPAVVTTTFGADSTVGFDFMPDTSGTARIIIAAFDSQFLVGYDTLFVTVVDVGEWPTVASAIPDTIVFSDSPPFAYRDLNEVFADAEDGGGLAFTITDNNNPSLINVAIDPDSALDLSVQPSQLGEAEIVVRAVDSGGLWVYDTFVIIVDPAPTAVGDDIPQKTVLYQNYPNPFNPSTTIAYQLSAPARVVLKIYDLQGREIRTLVDERQPAGTMTVVWDGKNNAGTMVSSGVYFYRLNAGTYTAAKRLVLLQ